MVTLLKITHQVLLWKQTVYKNFSFFLTGKCFLTTGGSRLSNCTSNFWVWKSLNDCHSFFFDLKSQNIRFFIKIALYINCDHFINTNINSATPVSYYVKTTLSSYWFAAICILEETYIYLGKNITKLEFKLVLI